MNNTNNSNNDQEFLGITSNYCDMQGVVQGDPIIHGDNYAFLTLRTSVREPDANGQWADIKIDVPCMTMDPNKVATIQKYVQDGRRVQLDTYYKSWMNQGTPQHAFIIKSIKLGRKKWIPTENAATPGLPVS